MSSNVAKVEASSSVIVEYSIKDEDGVVVDTSREKELLHYKMGSGGLFKKVEDALLGKVEKDLVSVQVCSKEAFGERDESLVQSVPRVNFANIVDFKRGMELAVQTPSGGTTVRVIDYDNVNITIDANHPLAGKDLLFEIYIVKIEN